MSDIYTLQPYTTFEFPVTCSICKQVKMPGEQMACLPEDDSYDDSDPWGCKECIEADPYYEVATDYDEWDRR